MFLSEPIFFEIPIYRCNSKQHSLEYKSYCNKVLNKIDKVKDYNHYQDCIDFLNEHFYYEWKYNETIGYINLFILGSQLRGEYWLIDKLRINKGITKKKYKFIGKILEKEIPQNLNSEEIFNFIIKNLIILNKSEFKTRVLFLNTFYSIGKFVNWVSLIKELNSFTNENFRNYLLEE